MLYVNGLATNKNSIWLALRRVFFPPFFTLSINNSVSVTKVNQSTALHRYWSVVHVGSTELSEWVGCYFEVMRIWIYMPFVTNLSLFIGYFSYISREMLRQNYGLKELLRKKFTISYIWPKWAFIWWSITDLTAMMKLGFSICPLMVF